MRERSDTRHAKGGEQRSWTNRERLETYWPELRGRAQERWSRLANEWLDEVDGRHERLAERLREAYGVSEQEANRQVDDFVETHWGALGAGNLTPGSSTSDSAGARGDTVTRTPASAETGPRGGGDTTGTHSPGPTRIRPRGDDSGIGTEGVNPGGRKI